MDGTKSSEPKEESDDARLERLRNDPNVVVHRGSGKPFAPEVWAKEGTDVLWLIGRRDEEWSDASDRDRRLQMAQRKPEDRPLEMDEAARERIRNDPRVITRYQSTTEPYVPKIVLKEPVDILWLIGRRDREWVDDDVWDEDEDTGRE